jgi:hypothetical protein
VANPVAKGPALSDRACCRSKNAFLPEKPKKQHYGRAFNSERAGNRFRARRRSCNSGPPSGLSAQQYAAHRVCNPRCTGCAATAARSARMAHLGSHGSRPRRIMRARPAAGDPPKIRAARGARAGHSCRGVMHSGWPQYPSKRLCRPSARGACDGPTAGHLNAVSFTTIARSARCRTRRRRPRLWPEHWPSRLILGIFTSTFGLTKR